MILEMLRKVRRVTDYIKLNGKDIALYIMQEPDLMCFRIQIFFGENTLVMVFKKTGVNWENITDNIPNWVDALIPGLETTIKQKLFVELN